MLKTGSHHNTGRLNVSDGLCYDALFPNPFPTPMNARKTYLLGIAFFTVLFMALVLLASWLLANGSKQFAVAGFLFAFAAVFGQTACLALYARRAAREKAAAQQKKV